MFLLNKTSLVFCSLRSQNTLSPKGKARMIRFIYGTAPSTSRFFVFTVYRVLLLSHKQPFRLVSVGDGAPTSRFLFLLFACLKTEKQKNKKSPPNKGRLFGFSDFKLRAVDFYSAFYYR